MEAVDEAFIPGLVPGWRSATAMLRLGLDLDFVAGWLHDELGLNETEVSRAITVARLELD